MKIKHAAAAFAMVLSAPTMAAVCSGGYGLGTLGPPGASWFGQTFSGGGNYLDCYSFSLSSVADSFGGTIELDVIANRLDIELTSISLFAGNSSAGSGTGSLLRTDSTPGAFSFGSLAAGWYTLGVASTVSRDRDGLWSAPVGYTGLIVTSRSSVASPAPEPETYAMMLAGLAGVVFVARRRKKS
jgi:hypothetical protein